MRELLNEIDWHHNLTPLSILEAWEFFTAHFNDILHQCVPLIKQRKKKNIYMSSNALRLKNRKNKLWKNYLISKSSDDFHRFCKVRNDLRTLTRTLRSDYERNLSLNVKHNPKAFLILDLKFVLQSMIFNVLMAPLHIQIKTKPKLSTTSLLVYSLKKIYPLFRPLLWILQCLSYNW